MVILANPWQSIGVGDWGNVPGVHPLKSASSTLEALHYGYLWSQHSCDWAGEPTLEESYRWGNEKGPSSASQKDFLTRWQVFRPGLESGASAVRRGQDFPEDKLEVWKRHHEEIVALVAPLEPMCLLCQWSRDSVLEIVEYTFATLGNPMVGAKTLFGAQAEFFMPIDTKQVFKPHRDAFGWPREICELTAVDYVDDLLGGCRKAMLQALELGWVKLRDGSVHAVHSGADLRRVAKMPAGTYEVRRHYPLGKLGDDLLRVRGK